MGSLDERHTHSSYEPATGFTSAALFLCTVDGCVKPRGSNGRGGFYRFCNMHRGRWRQHKDTSGEYGNPKPDHRMKARYRYAKVNGRTEYVHRLVWAATYGLIPEGYHIHHLDGNGLNNDLSNLVAVPPTEHVRYHQ